jgi:hypothetical protein
MTRIICHFVLWVCMVGRMGHIHTAPELTGSSNQQLADTVVTLYADGMSLFTVAYL